MEDQNRTGDRLTGKSRKFPNGNAEAKQKLIELRSQGASYDSIAGQLQVSRQTLQNWCKEMQPEIATAINYRIDEIKAKYQMLQSHRIEQFGMMLHRLREEAAKRDLSEVPTDKILDLLLKFGKEARHEERDLSFVEREILGDISFEDWTRKVPMV